MSIFKKNKKKTEDTPHAVSPQAEAKNLEYRDEPANPKDVSHAAPGAAMNEAAMPPASQVPTAPGTDSREKGKDESERRDNVEPF